MKTTSESCGLSRTRTPARPAVISSFKYATAIASGALLLTGCLGNVPDQAPATLAAPGPTETVAKESATVKKPFMFGEAKLPEGYPKPGPVGEVMIKTYPASRVAMVQASEMAGANANGMFWPLFNHIKKEKISMTAPVLMGYDDPKPQAENGPVSMGFVYEDVRIGRPGTDGNVKVVDLPPLTVASVGVRGSYNEDHLHQGLEQIREWLAQNGEGYEVSGPPRYLGYNSPFVPWFLRYGEVQVLLKPR